MGTSVTSHVTITELQDILVIIGRLVKHIVLSKYLKEEELEQVLKMTVLAVY